MTKELLEQALEALEDCDAAIRHLMQPAHQDFPITKTSATSAIETISAELAKPQDEPCTWTLDDELSETYASRCGELWSFIDGGPIENRVRYCHHCGRPVKLGEKP